MSHDRDEILQAIRVSATELVGIDPTRVTADARWEDVPLDRYDFFGILRDLEAGFGVEISSDDSFDALETGLISALIDLVVSLRS